MYKKKIKIQIQFLDKSNLKVLNNKIVNLKKNGSSKIADFGYR